ncbi:hypothetical protein GGTG_11455 [Gaeumannomyces tritici R3-111a-1]|uniref:Uncharacterized protein n=1 Tax=Gaeumannomyces tritici (strain R3-111a-1) TaxID=644352 RepID=J3PD86_GAET3|nr:hypothetical protein GGTG_11455 [Gaeumannomyces tritici R3-111a-1]EJT70431.1 hypothetical protein GGTG_11455 [Gaeumannomyces tritici R3-111a-1]
MVLHNYHKQCYERNRSSRSYIMLQNRSRGSYGLPGWTGGPDHITYNAVPGWEASRARDDVMRDAVNVQVRVMDRRGCHKETPAQPIISDAVDTQPEMVKPEQSALMHSEEDYGTRIDPEVEDTTGQEPPKPRPKRKTVAIDIASLPTPEAPTPPAANDGIGQVSNLRQHYAFVDHLTAVMARVATHCINSSYWRAAVLAVLAELSTKLKIVAIDLPGNVESCLRRNGFRLRLEGSSYGHDLNEATAAEVEWRFPPVGDNDTVASRYSVENSVVGRWLQDCLAQILTELSGGRGGRRHQQQQPLHLHEAELDVSVLVFRAGANAVPTLVQQDLQGNHPLGEARLGVCVERWGKEGELDARHGIEVERHEVAITDAAGLVTVLAPLALAQPALGRQFRMLLQEMSALNAFGELSPPALDFTALISLQSGQHPRTESEDSGDPLRMSKSPLRAGEQNEPDAVPLSRSLLAQNRLHALLRSSANDFRSSRSAGEEAVKQTIRDATENLEAIRDASSTWVIEETAVIVKCPVYVWTTVFLCFVLVAGGMTIGFLVGDRIAGVDPFGITSMDAQDIIMFLLSTQTQNKLVTRGPFNRPFKSAAETGFSIDVQPELRTLMACGLVPVKVATLQGPHLVFLDLMPEAGNRLTVIDHSRRSLRTGESFLGFAIPPDPRSASDEKLQRYSSLAWVKVLGLYTPRG